MGNFWPTLPITIPYSEGVPMWWDIVFWIFQAAVMTSLVIILVKWGTGIDRMRDEDKAE